jgi:acetyl esterase/lipase
MRNFSLTALIMTTLIAVGHAQSPAPATSPAWEDPANWNSVKPIETDNIVYAQVPRIANPSAAASPDPGSPNGIRPAVPNTGPTGTMDLHVDVYQIPSSKPTPVILQIHGGGWIRGDRPTSYRSFGPFMAAGMSVVTVEYRNAKDAPAPAAIEDVRCAMAWVKRNAAKYNFDANDVVPWGGSAGGHLALMAGYAPPSFNPPGCTDQPKVTAVLDMYGASDVASALTYPGSRDFTHQWIGLDLPLPPDPAPSDGAITAGSATAATATSAAPTESPNPDGMPRTRRQSPRWPEPTEAVLARAREVSPLTYIHPGLPPTFIINGDKDHTYEPTQSYRLKAALDAAHVPNQEDVVVGGGHGNFTPADNQKGMIMALQFLRANGVLK